LLDAAFRVFSSEGYAAASLDRIADAAGFSKGAVYSRFASKADLFLAVLERRIDHRAADNAAELAAAVATDGDVIAALATRMATTSAADADWHLALTEFRVIAARDPELRERYAAIHAGTIGRLASLFDQLVGRLARAPQVPSRSLARVVLGMEAGGVLEDAAASEPIPLEDQIHVLRGILGADLSAEATS
jgi:AcrR family transcriptional regulator